MSIIEVDRIVHEVRCGRPVIIDGVGFAQPEYIKPADINKFKNARLIITNQRAKKNFSKNFKANVSVNIEKLSFNDIQLLVQGKRKLSAKKIIEPRADNSKTSQAALEISRIAQVLPCAIMFDSPPKTALKISSSKILSYKNKITESLEIVADAPLKLCDAKKASIVAFRSRSSANEHLAIVIGNRSKEPLIRIHSSCYTGDLLGSLTCDCGDQLRGAIKLMNEKGGGIILYLMQEGRGIGLVNKLKAYKLQSEGLDTVEANEILGFDDEERAFEPAALMLKKLGIKKVRLITNNPKKIKELERLGIKVKERIPMVIQHEHNHLYLKVKSDKSGHLI